ncbi:hypothetical protein K6Q96_05765 [Grimontia kaedaensis]|uniref:Glycosyltransferase RgtA/B/C/D-like domain-containing protein n=1 Tax=Grimontia kaedaensis TaxID=2872157 RepID=A0ABY4WV84_9GAMM|nr:hypothetical protein [Grimontia kaedaensis]USH03504.1 hypothetical protein K6Q96_05765 [Grimontia kaedaensis]
MDRLLRNPYTIFQFVMASFLIFGAGFLLSELATDVLANGGHKWKQGDWLVNTLNADVRRGPLGTLFIGISDVLNVSPIIIVGAFQASLVILSFFLLGKLVSFASFQNLAFALLLASPGLFAIFWVVDPDGAFRKELVAFTALLTLLYAFRVNSVAWAMLGTLLFSLAVYGHEVNVLFLPLVLLCLSIWYRTSAQPKFLLVLAILSALLACHALYYHLSNKEVDDVARVCAPLLERGVSNHVCEGSINWLNKDLGDVKTRFSTISVIDMAVIFPLAYIGAALPLLMLLFRLNERKYLYLALISGLPFAPLYFVGIDWGRWLSMHIFSMTCILLLSIISGNASFKEPPSWKFLGVIAIAGMLWAPLHITGVYEGGFALRFLYEVYGSYLALMR